MPKLKVVLCYCGQSYFGSQIQKKELTVEGALLEALFKVYRKNFKVYFSGRTDTGVHAHGQVFHFDPPFEIPLPNLKRALNKNLDRSIFIRDIEYVGKEFHARFSATSRTYQYLFSVIDVPLYLQDFVQRVYFNIDISLFKQCCELIVGHHDFSSFMNLGSKSGNPFRTVSNCQISNEMFKCIYTGELIPIFKFEISSKSFLYRMVRNLVGICFDIQKGLFQISDLKDQLSGNTKRLNYTTAPAKGLCLVNVLYNKE